MFRIDYKTGRRIYGEDDLNTSTVPHKLAKMGSKTGNYNKGAEAARSMFPHLAVTKDPESEAYVLPVKNAVYPIVEPVVGPAKTEKGAQALFKKPEPVACGSLWKSFGEVEQFLEDEEPELKEQVDDSKDWDDWTSTRATGRSSICSSLSDDSIQVFHSSGEEQKDSGKAVKEPDEASAVAVAPAVAEETSEEPEEMELGAEATNIAAAARAISERTKNAQMNGRSGRWDVDFSFMYEKDLREKTCVFKEEEGEFTAKYVDYYFLGEDPREEFRHLANRKRDSDDDEMIGGQ